MINEFRLLNEANSYFLDKNFEKALFLYSQLSSNFPDNKEYPMYAIFCDIASEDETKALSLYDYFTVAKEEDMDEAINYVNEIVNSYGSDIEKMMNLFDELEDDKIDSLDAIKYDDFKQFIHSRGSFKVAFEDIMFSTKVAIESKEDFFDFVDQLIDNGFSNTAYSYLDGFNDYFSYDEQIEKLYKKLEEKNIAISHK